MENENWGEDIISLMDEEGNQSEYKIVAGYHHLRPAPGDRPSARSRCDGGSADGCRGAGIPEGERGAG